MRISYAMIGSEKSFENYLTFFSLFGVNLQGIPGRTLEFVENGTIIPWWQMVLRDLLLPEDIENLQIIPDGQEFIEVNPYDIFTALKNIQEFNIRLTRMGIPPDSNHYKYSISIRFPEDTDDSIYLEYYTKLNGETAITPIVCSPVINDIMYIGILSLRATNR